MLVRLLFVQLVDLKAALYRKQQEFKREKVSQTGSDSTVPLTKKVSDKVCYGISPKLLLYNCC